MRQQFERDGYVHVGGCFDENEMTGIEAEYDRLVRDVIPKLPRHEAMHEDYDRPETLKQVNVRHEDSPAWTQLKGSDRMQGLMEALLGEEATSNTIELFIKPPKVGTPTPPHQDNFYFCLRPNSAATLWLALDDMDEENGALGYVAGSHKFGVLPHAPSQVLGFSQGLEATELSTYGKEVTCRMKRGDLLAHHCDIIHYAGGNRTDRLRRALAVVFRGKSAKRDEEAFQRYQDSVQSQQRKIGARD